MGRASRHTFSDYVVVPKNDDVARTKNAARRERRKRAKSAVRKTPLECVDEAIALVKKMGFEFVVASMKSTSSYYRFPGCKGLLRIGMHRKGKANVISHGPVYGSITFPTKEMQPDQKLHMAEGRLENIIAVGIGYYFVKEYRTQDGTAETKQGDNTQASGSSSG